MSSKYDVESRDQSLDFGMVSIHNIKTHMTSDDVIISGVDSIVLLDDVNVHLR